MNRIIVLLLCLSLVGFPGFSKGTKEETGELVGSIVGGLSGAAAGAAALSFIPGLGTVTGFIAGGAVGFAGSLIGMKGGGALGQSIGRSMDDAYDYDPIFDVLTKIELGLLDGNSLLLYPTPSSDSQITIIGNQISVKINMTPSMIADEETNEEIDEGTDVVIPVIVQIITTEEAPQIVCEHSEGLSNLTRVESDLEGIFYYGQLDASEETKTILFNIESTEPTCSIQFNVFYGASGNKVIVSEDSNTSSTFNLSFIDEERIMTIN